MTFRKAYCEATKLLDRALVIFDRQNKLIEDLQSKNKMEICKYQRQVSRSEEVKAELERALQMNTENLRLLDSYIETNARQAQDIIELESVAISLYDVLWHQVHSVENELEEKHAGVADLNAYKTIKALFEAEGETE